MKIKVNFLKGALLLLLFAASSSFALAQRTISGLVTDESNGETLIGASVVVTGTTKGTLTDVDGKYSLDVPADAKSLTFSFTGYSSLTIPLGASNVVNAALKGGATLETVVVNAGYQTIKTKEVTSSIASVKSEDFNKGNVNDPVQLLQGKVAGLSIARPGGNPNGDFTIRLRGISTIGANVQPLVVVDGVPNVPMSLVDPNDIESIDVLKDGAAAAIYGAQGSSGVILITTKKGVAGKTSVDYNVQLINDRLANKPSFMSAADYKAANQAAGNALADVDKGSTTDWFDQITRSANSQIHNLSLSGSAGKTVYRAALNYRGIQGVTLNDGFKQLNARFNLSQKALDDKLTFTIDASASDRKVDYGMLDAFRYAVTYNPTAPVYDPTNVAMGGYNQLGGFDNFNPRAVVDQSTVNGHLKRLQISGGVAYEILKDLKVSTLYSINQESNLTGEYYDRNAAYRGKDRSGLLRRYTQDLNKDYFNFLVNYKKDFDKFTLNAVAGYDLNKQVKEGFGINDLGNFTTDSLGYYKLNAAGDRVDASKVIDLPSEKKERLLEGVFARLSGNYDNTYFAQVSVRQDGSSMLSPGNKRKVFPAASAGVALHKLFKLPKVDNLKFRVSYGLTGALPPEENLSQPTYEYSPGTRSYVITRNPTTDLKWEQKAEFNVGFDFAALDARLTGSIEYYNRTITDLIYFFPNINPLLFEQAGKGKWANAGDLVTSGIEIVASYQILKPSTPSGLNWKAGINFATNNNELKKLKTTDFAASSEFSNVGAPGLNGIPIIYLQAGQPIGQIWTFPYTGVDASGNPTAVSGSDGKTYPIGGPELLNADKKVVGNGLPKFTLGLNNNFTLGNLDLNFFFRGVFGHSLVNEYRVFYENANSGSLKSYNRIKTTYWDPAIKTAQFHSRYVEKADFVRLDNLTLGYTFEAPKGSSLGKIRAFFSGNNLLTFTGYTGVDPEISYTDVGSADNGGRPSRILNPDPLVPGIDRRTNYFTTRSFSLGVNIGF